MGCKISDGAEEEESKMEKLNLRVGGGDQV